MAEEVIVDDENVGHFLNNWDCPEKIDTDCHLVKMHLFLLAVFVVMCTPVFACFYV